MMRSRRGRPFSGLGGHSRRNRAALATTDLVMVVPRTAIWLLSLLLSAPALAADELQWGFFGDNVDARLFYGVPESDVTTLNIICQPKRRRIDFVSFVLPPGPRPGATLRIRLSNGTASLEYQGKVGRDRTHGATYVEA